jgi:SAM-dependent methyltransferase
LAKALAPGQVIGVDISEASTKRATESAAAAELPNIRFERSDICRLDYQENSFDAVFSSNAIEHNPEPNKVLREMHRVLKPGGVIGVRDVDHGGFLIAPDSGLLAKMIVIWDSHLESVGAYGKLGRHLGRLLHEAGFVDIRMSASYDFFCDPEGRKIVAESAIGHLSTADVANYAISSGLSSADELDAIKEELRIWQDLPGAFFADAHCEAVGRKP